MQEDPLVRKQKFGTQFVTMTLGTTDLSFLDRSDLQATMRNKGRGCRQM